MLTTQDLIAFTQDHTTSHKDYTSFGGALNLFTQEPEILREILLGIGVYCIHKVCEIQGDYIQLHPDSFCP